jgi:hypothetical protein
MKIYRIADYYSVNRDDSELRVVVCPKCKKADITKTDEVIALAENNHPLKLCKCNSKKCGVYFAFYREDGMRDISKQEAEQGIKDEHIDLQEEGKEKGKDSHGHCYYVAFTDKPKTISQKEYDAIIDMEYEEEQKWKSRNLFDAGMVVRNWDILSKIDWEIL